MPVVGRTCAVMVALLLLGGEPAVAAKTVAGQPFDINAVLPITGSAAFLGATYKSTLVAAENVINASGGIAGRPVHFVVADSTTSPPVSVELTNGLSAANVPVFFEGGPSAICNATLALVEKKGPVSYCLSNGVHPDAQSFAFALGPSTTESVETLVRFLRTRGWSRLAVITGTDSTGEDFDVQLAHALALPENANMHVLVHEHFSLGDLTVAAQMARIKATSPQVVVTWSTGTPFGTILHGMQNAGIDLPVTSVPSNQNYTAMKQLATVLPRELFFPGPRAVARNGVRKGPVLDAQIVYHKALEAIGLRSDFATDAIWDPVMIVVTAFRTIGPNATAAQIHDYIENLHSWAGINGIYDFRDGSQRGIGAIASDIQRWDPKSNEFVAVSRSGGIAF
jgi:branched-chain amino acid transport system substrate-binding protein